MDEDTSTLWVRYPRNFIRLRLKCDGTHAETRFRLSAKRTNPFKSAGGVSFLLLAAEVCVSAVVMLDTPCSEVVWRVLATHSIHQFPLHFPSRASPCAITFQLDATFISNQTLLQLRRQEFSSFSLLLVLFNVTWYRARRHLSVECPLPFHYKKSNYAFFSCGTATQRGSWPPHSWGFLDHT